MASDVVSGKTQFSLIIRRNKHDSMINSVILAPQNLQPTDSEEGERKKKKMERMRKNRSGKKERRHF